MINGDVDELRVSGELFAATLAAAGRDIVVLAFEPGTEHGHLNRPDEPAASATLDRIAAWLDRGFEPAASDLPRHPLRLRHPTLIDHRLNPTEGTTS